MKRVVSELMLLAALLSAPGCPGNSPKLPFVDPEEFGKGNDCVLKGDYAGAVENYDRVLELDPNYAMAFNNRGAAHYLRGEYGPAEKDFNEAVSIVDRLAPAWNNLGYAQQKLGDFRAAADSHSRAVWLNPRFANAYYGRGLACYELGWFKQAARDFKMAMDLPVEDGRTSGPEASAALYVQGNADQEMEDYLDQSGREFTTVEMHGGALWYVTHYYAPASFNYGFDQAFVLFPGGPGPREMREQALAAQGNAAK